MLNVMSVKPTLTDELYSAANDPRLAMIPKLDRKWSQTGNDPQIGPQMIPNHKWSPMWEANDPRRKGTNGMDFGFLDF